MSAIAPRSGLSGTAQATDARRLRELFGEVDGLLPLWIAEPYVELAPAVREALEARSAVGWYGYETRPREVLDAFWTWASQRHGWDGTELRTSVSPSVGTSIGVLIDQRSSPGDGVILQPPVFTDFKPLVNASHRSVIRNPLALTEAGYRMDLDALESLAAEPTTRVMILCNPHNPVGRVWSIDELRSVAEICARNDVFVIADEIHADLALAPNRFVPFADAAAGTGVGWAAIHGPIKTFGLAGVCDTLLITDDDDVRDAFAAVGSRLHLARNNVFGIAAFVAGYRSSGGWLDGLLELTANHVRLLRSRLPEEIGVTAIEGTYLAWLDFSRLGMDVPELATWLAGSARLALSPGHWFGREGAGFARMTIAAPTEHITEAIERLTAAVGGRR